MPMQAESLEVLEKASVAPAQARAFVRAIEIEIAGAKDTLATKLNTSLEVQMVQLEATLRTEMAKQRANPEFWGVLYWAILGQMAVLLGFANFFATHLS